MTGKEAFGKYAGWTIQGSASGKYYKLCGYVDNAPNWVMVTPLSPNGYGEPILKAYVDSGWVMLPNLSESDKYASFQVNDFMWDGAIPPDTGHRQVCCRCGARYDSKKKHRLECGKKQ